MHETRLASGGRIRILVGDLVEQEVDAIVNAANERMLGGGGVDGAIHRAAGPRLLAACRSVAEVVPGVRCPTGEARLTPGFDLPARYVIHTVGPVYESHGSPREALGQAHRSVLKIAAEEGLSSIAFPAISCGAFGFPPHKAAPIAWQSCLAFAGKIEEIRFVLSNEDLFAVWTKEVSESVNPR